MRLTVSVVIPCATWHAEKLPGLIRALNEGTDRPDEIVVVVPASSKVRLRHAVVMEVPSQMPPGAARQIATRDTACDIVVYQDADDIPHPQRIEILRRFFAETEYVHVNHAWTPPDVAFQSQDTYHIVADTQELLAEYGESGSFPMPYGAPWKVVTVGNPAVRRCVLSDCHWNLVMMNGEDALFCVDVLRKYHRSAIISNRIYQYTKPGVSAAWHKVMEG